MQVSESVTFKRGVLKKEKDCIVIRCAVHDIELDPEFGCILCWHEQDEHIRGLLKGCVAKKKEGV